jgi:TonB family protein
LSNPPASLTRRHRQRGGAKEMFANLIESQSHGKEFKRRGRFVIATAFAYTVLFFVAGIVSVLAYDARLEAQTNDLEILNWVPPVDRAIVDPARTTRPIRRLVPSSAPVDNTARRPERTDFVSRTDDPNKIPEGIGVKASDVPPITDGAVLSHRNVDPPRVAPTNGDACITCSATPPVVRVEETPPRPALVKPQIQRLQSTVLVSKAISLPQPPYPPIAKQIRAQGPVSVQILVDEQGRVISAQALSGNPTLLSAARDAAMRARFSPTLLSGTPVKVQGTIIYNFVLQ